MNIFKTFEIFLREPLSILKNRLIQIVNINSGLQIQPGINVEMLDNKAQITVYNSDKMYNLLKTVQYKQSMLKSNNSTELKEKKQIVLGQLLGRK